MGDILFSALKSSRCRIRPSGSRDGARWKVEPICPYVFLWAGLVQGCLRNHSGAVWALNLKENRRFYGFTDFRGKLARRGRGSRATRPRILVTLPPDSTQLNSTQLNSTQLNNHNTETEAGDWGVAPRADPAAVPPVSGALRPTGLQEPSTGHEQAHRASPRGLAQAEPRPNLAHAMTPSRQHE